MGEETRVMAAKVKPATANSEAKRNIHNSSKGATLHLAAREDTLEQLVGI